MERRTFLQASALGLLAPVTSLRSTPRRRPGDPLRLNANENPLGLSPAARQAVLDGLPDANRYPFALHRELVEVVARHHGVEPDMVVLGAGSAEILQMAVQAFAQGGATFVLADPTFEQVPGYAEPWGLRVERVPLRADHAHDLQRMREVCKAANGPTVVHVCNPNNPTGTLTPAKELDDWIGSAKGNVTFLVDEAYADFAEGAPGFHSMSKWIATRDDVIVTRTFSKIHGMAGLRLGYGLARRATAARLRRLASHNNCNGLVLAAGRASLTDAEHRRASLECNARARQVVHDVLAELELACLPSHTNFVMHEVRGELPPYIERMREAGILVGRPFPPMLRHNRLSLGTPEEMSRFAEVLRGFRKKGWV
jgi:histidinol-phosphate aminotransferase